jgi:two-component sensor histidine kinase
MPTEQKIKFTNPVNFIWIGLFFSTFYWVLESVRDMMIYNEGSLFKWIFIPSAMSLWMRMLVICIIMLFSAYTQSVRQKAESKKKGLEIFWKMNIVWIGLAFGLFYWILEAFRDVFVFQKGNFLKQIFFPDPMGFWMRLLAVCILILFSLYLKTLMNERNAVEAKLREMREQLLKETSTRSSELKESQEALKKKIQDFKSEENKLREQLRQKESLLRGAHQIIKDNLQHLNALFDMRIMETENKSSAEIYTEFRALIYTLTLVHSQLYKTDYFDRINLGNFLQDLKEYLLHLNRKGKIDIYIEDKNLILSTHQAVPCVLVISELVFLATQKSRQQDVKRGFQIFLKRSEDNTLSVKIRHDDSKILPGLEDKKPELANYKWIQEIVKEQLHGDFWVVRSPQSIEINYDFEINILNQRSLP